MSAVAWLLVGLAVASLLGRARVPLSPLPAPRALVGVPPYVLVTSGEVPALEPPPRVVYASLASVPEGAGRILVLAAGTQVQSDLPARLAACPEDFVSIFPQPTDRGSAEEVWLRDFARPRRVVDPLAPEAFADPRCAWLRSADLHLPGTGDEPVLRVARARKAHGLPVDLRSGLGAGGTPIVRAASFDARSFREALPDRTQGDPLVRFFLGAFPLVLLALTVVFAILPETRATACLAIGLGVTARAWRAWQSRTGWPLVLTGLWHEPRLALAVWQKAIAPAPAPFPQVPTGPAPRLTGPQVALHGLDARLDASAVLHLARRLGGSATVMEQIYQNRPSGRTALGLLIDRWVHASVGARALRHRRLLVAEMGRAQRPTSVVSVPAGSARDAAGIGAPQTVLVDPDPVARNLATATCPQAEVVNGLVETTPAGPFELAIYVGLVEYLDDAEVVRHLTLLRARLASTGTLISSTTAPHPEQQFMAERLGWKTRARKPDAFAALLDAAGFRVEQRLGDVAGVQWVFLSRPIGQRGSGPSPAVS